VTPVGPVNPVSPVGPVIPVSPVGPVLPVSPSIPVGPVVPGSVYDITSKSLFTNVDASTTFVAVMVWYVVLSTTFVIRAKKKEVLSPSSKTRISPPF
jgi:hypothetical protein